MYPNRFDSFHYNFNTREGYKDLKLRFLIKTGVMSRFSVPIGTIDQN